MTEIGAAYPHVRRFLDEALRRWSASDRLPLAAEGIAIDEVRRAMMRLYGSLRSSDTFLQDFNAFHDELPVEVEAEQLYLREILYALLLRSAILESRRLFTIADYDTVTLAWRCTIGPLHPDDDNDVCRDAYVEWQARRLQRKTPGLSRPAARIQAFLMKPR